MKVIRILILCLIALLITMSTVQAQMSFIVSSPKAGDSWKLGETKNIEWNLPQPVVLTWKLELMKGTTVLGTIAGIVSGNSYRWVVGQYIGGTATPGTGYKIRISHFTQTQISSDSGVFSILFSSIGKISATPKQPITAAPKPQLTTAPKQLPPMEKKELSVRMIFPNGGEKLEAGRSYTVKWEGTSVGRSGNVNVGLFRGSTQVALLCTNVPNTGSCTGRIDPQIHYQPLRVKVWSAGPILFPADESDGDVMIANYRNIKILSPNGGETWKLGDPLEIRWDTGGGWEGVVSLSLVQASTSHEVRLTIFTYPNTPWVQNTGVYTFDRPFDGQMASSFYNFQIPNGDFRVCLTIYGGGNLGGGEPYYIETAVIILSLLLNK